MAPSLAVDLRFLTRNKHMGVPGTLDSAWVNSDNSSITEFNAAVDKWFSGQVKSLNIKSPMDTGKSSVLATLVEESRAKTVLVLTYRVTLAQEMARKLPDFACYLDVPGDATPNLNDEAAFPKV